MGSSRLWLLLLASGAVACASLRASYSSWEPTSANVPPVRDRKLALADLEVSRELWRERGWQRYSYVRAWQRSLEQVEFTMIVVHDGRVVERSLLSSATDSSGLGDRFAGERGQPPRLLWREQAADIGRHDAAAPALTLDQLYDLCRDRVLSVRGEHAPRLSFHRDGLLQHCGFLNEHCPDCPAASVQTVGQATPQRGQTPPDLLCTDRYGLFLHEQNPLTSGGCEMCRCMGHHRAEPGASAPPAAPMTPEARELCVLSGRHDCSQPEPAGTNICQVDPAACPRPGLLPAQATWQCLFLLSADCAEFGRAQPLSPECLALARPKLSADPGWRRRCL